MISNILGASWLETENQVSESGGPGGQIIPNPFANMQLLSAFPALLYCIYFSELLLSTVTFTSPLSSPNLRRISKVYPCVDPEEIFSSFISPVISTFYLLSNSFSSTRDFTLTLNKGCINAPNATG